MAKRSSTVGSWFHQPAPHHIKQLSVQSITHPKSIKRLCFTIAHPSRVATTSHPTAHRVSSPIRAAFPVVRCVPRTMSNIGMRRILEGRCHGHTATAEYSLRYCYQSSRSRNTNTSFFALANRTAVVHNAIPCTIASLCFVSVSHVAASFGLRTSSSLPLDMYNRPEDTNCVSAVILSAG
jgi:hypothetical protein